MTHPIGKYEHGWFIALMIIIMVEFSVIVEETIFIVPSMRRFRFLHIITIIWSEMLLLAIADVIPTDITPSYWCTFILYPLFTPIAFLIPPAVIHKYAKRDGLTDDILLKTITKFSRTRVAEVLILWFLYGFIMTVALNAALGG